MSNRPNRRAAWGLRVVGVASACLGLVAPAAARPSAAELLPESTTIFVTISSVPELITRFQNTATGHMARDPQLRPLLERLYGMAGEAMAEVQEEVGLSLSDMLAIPQGEVAFGLVCPEGRMPQPVFLIDAGDQIGSVETLLTKLKDEWAKEGVAKREETINDTKVTVYEGRQLTFFVKENTVVITQYLDMAKSVLAAWDGSDVPTLADNPRYATVASRCRGSKDLAPQILAFADPITVFKSATLADGGAGMRVALAMLPTLGLDGLVAVGGSLTMDAGPFDSIMQFHVLMDNPRTGVLEVIALKSGDFEPEPWVPADVAHYSTLHWDFRRSVNKIAALQDSFWGEGAFQKSVAQTFTRETDVNFDKDFIDSLDGRVSLLVWIEQPITLTSQNTLVAFRLKDPKPVEAALERMFQKHQRRLTKQMYAGKTYYQTAVRGPDDPPIPEDMPQPHPCIGVLDNYLLASNQPGIFRQVIVTAADPSKSLAHEPDFKLIAGKIERMAGSTKPSWIGFDRPEEGLRFVYGLATADKTREFLRSEAENNPFFSSINTALDEHPLPPFAVLVRYFAPGGTLLIDDETGLHYTAFSLRRKLD
ncbi:MAG: DUF3352 domain-containing protein [Pirellulales bacterium]|nr:DUF3352 domain-containing protein [Pirellulales bacterium]